MRTTVRIDEHLLAQAERRADETGRTLTAVLEKALREPLGRRPRQPGRGPVSLTTFKGTGPRPGVDLDDTSSLMDAMET